MNQSQNELVIVVDKNDNPIDYVSRGEAHQQKLLHRTVVITVYNDKDQVLLQKRSSKMDNNPGKWSNASGGHVPKDSSYEEAAQREIMEELGISPKLTHIKTTLINDPAHMAMTAIYKTASNGPFNFNTEEIDEVKFFSVQDLKEKKLDLTESARIALHEQGVL